MLRTLEGILTCVAAVALTPDGKRAVSASWDTTLKVWDLERGEVLRTLEGHSNVVAAVALTPDGKRAVSASWDKNSQGLGSTLSSRDFDKAVNCGLTTAREHDEDRLRWHLAFSSHRRWT